MTWLPTPSRRAAGLVALGAVVLAAVALAAGVGASGLGLGDLVSGLLGGGDAWARGIVFNRLARVLLAACVGGALASAGAA